MTTNEREPQAGECVNCGSETTDIGSGLSRCKICGRIQNRESYQTGGYELDLDGIAGDDDEQGNM